MDVDFTADQEKILKDFQRLYDLNYTFAFEYILCLTTDFAYSFSFGVITMQTAYLLFVLISSHILSSPAIFFTSAAMGIWMTTAAGYLMHLKEVKLFITE